MYIIRQHEISNGILRYDRGYIRVDIRQIEVKSNTSMCQTGLCYGYFEELKNGNYIRLEYDRVVTKAYTH